MASVSNSGSQTATLATEHVLATVITAGQYQCVVDVANLVLGETLTLKIYGKARTGDTERLIKEYGVTNAQDEALIQLDPIVSPHHLKFTLEQNGGTGRAFPWAVYAID